MDELVDRSLPHTVAADDDDQNNVDESSEQSRKQPPPTTTPLVVDETVCSNHSPETPPGTPEEKLTGQNVFEELVNAITFKGALRAFRRLCNALNIDSVEDHRQFYTKLSSLVLTWRAKHLWAKLSKRATDPIYQKGNAAINSKVLVIGAGPCGLRTAIECAFLGAKVVLIEKRDSFTRNNVLHLWDVVIRDLTSLGAKKLYKKFCISSIDHISIRQLQLILVKIALLLGVEIHHSVTFEDVLEPQSHDQNWTAKCTTEDPQVQQRLNEYEFDVLVGADGRRNSFSDFKRYANRAKLAIAITANFRNSHTNEENYVPEIAGVTSYAKPELFQKLSQQKINLENIVYYKDATHYFIMTAHKASLLERKVLLSDHCETDLLLSENNINQEALLKFAQDAAGVATDGKLPLKFAKNHYNQPDVAMFDFTSMYYADHAARIYKKHGKFLLKLMVGDSLIEPFWPTGSGIGKGFLSSFDAAWSVKNWCSGLSVNQILAQQEAAYKSLFTLISSDKLKPLPAKQFYPIDPYTRYTVMSLPTTKDIADLFISDETENLEDTSTEIVPLKQLDPNILLQWVQKTLLRCERNYSDFVRIDDLTKSWHDGRAFAVLLHIFQPELINIEKARALIPEEMVELVFNKLQSIGIFPGITPSQFIAEVPDQITILSILMPLYNRFHDVLPANEKPKYNRILDANQEFLLNKPGSVSGDEKRVRSNHSRHHYHHRNASVIPSNKTGDKATIPLFAQENGASSTSGGTPKTKKAHKIVRKLDLTDNKWIESLNDDPASSGKAANGEKKVHRTRKMMRSVGGSGDGEVSDDSSATDENRSGKRSRAKKPGAEKVKCLFCKEDVLMLDRMLLENHHFHRSCFRCIYCKKVLTERTYSYFKSDDGTSNHFYCSTHHRWRTEGYIGPPAQVAEKLPGHKANDTAPNKEKKTSFAALLSDIPIQQVMRPVERIAIEVSKGTPAVKKELTEEEMSDFNYGPGYQTAENISEASSEEPSDFAPNSFLDSAVLSPDTFTNWREVYSARNFVAGTKPGRDDKGSKSASSFPTKAKRKQVESEDDADDEGDTEIDRSENEDEDSGTEIELRVSESSSSKSDEDSSCVNTAQEVSDPEVKAKATISASPSKRKNKSYPPRVKLPVSAFRVQPDDSETEVESEKVKSSKPRRARRPRPTKEPVMKVNAAVMRLKTEVQPEPMSLDVLLGVNKNHETLDEDHYNNASSPEKSTSQHSSAVIHRRGVIETRKNFLQNQAAVEIASNEIPNPSITEKALETDCTVPSSTVPKVDESSSPSSKSTYFSNEISLRQRTTSTSSDHKNALALRNIEDTEARVKKTLDYIPKSSALSLIEQLDQTYKPYKKETVAPLEPLKQVRIVTPPPEEKMSNHTAADVSPPIPAFDPRVNVENSVRKALGSKTREEERQERKARLSMLKASHFGAVATTTDNADRSATQNGANSSSVIVPIPQPLPVSNAKPPLPASRPVASFKMTTYMSKEFTKLPGSSTINVQNTFSKTMEVPVKPNLSISSDAASLILQQKAKEITKKSETGELFEQEKMIKNTANVKQGSFISPLQRLVNRNSNHELKSSAQSPISSKVPELKAIEPPLPISKAPSSSVGHTRSLSSTTDAPRQSPSKSQSSAANVNTVLSQRPQSYMTISKSDSTPFDLSPDSGAKLSGFRSDNEHANSACSNKSSKPDNNQQVNAIKTNTSVKLAPKSPSKPQPILSYNNRKDVPDISQCFSDTERDDPGVLSDCGQVKVSKSGSLRFFKRFRRPHLSSDKESKLTHQKSTPALNDTSNYFDDPNQQKSKTLGRENACSPTVPRKEKKPFSFHFRIKSATLKPEKTNGSSKKDQIKKSDSKLGINIPPAISSDNSNLSTTSPLAAKEKNSPVAKPGNEIVELKKITNSGVQETGKEIVKFDKANEEVVVASVANADVSSAASPVNTPVFPKVSPQKEDKPPETPQQNFNNEAAETLKVSRKARQTKQREKIKQMQLKLGLKCLPGTLENKIDSITDFCAGRRTPGLNKDLDELYNEVACSEKNLPYYKQTDIRRSMEKLTDGKLQTVEISLDDNATDPTNKVNGKNGTVNGIESGHREREMKQMELIAKRMENLEHVSRCQNLERVSREIDEKEVVVKSVSERGELIEKSLMDKKLKKKEKADLTQKWLEVKQELDKLTADIGELVYSREQLILDVRHYNLKQEIRDLMSISDANKTAVQINREKELLQEIIQVVEEKNQLVDKLENERLLDVEQTPPHDDTTGDTSSVNLDPNNVSSRGGKADPSLSTSSLKSKRKLKTMFKK